MKKLILFFLIIFKSQFNLLAQTTATGCYTSWDNATHTYGPYGANNVYANNTGRVSLLPGYCNWVPTTSTSNCRVCPGWLITSGANTGRCQVSEGDNTLLATQPGSSGTFRMIPCPIDHNIIYGNILFAIVGIYFIRRKVSTVK
ncbi:hypothetical protein EA772_11105 [Pedobacter sp. G11]|uniref:hypothetical protein n=1 Tax=Pedobacter sp. G11 TaxID=2482728 RepID=UPI000F5F5D44|nr:hypothetical protein [Pedobacter sp. G11]AZI25863.1 hypothetical protein EA772_11105 [Pedobacter sp. G11]